MSRVRLWWIAPALAFVLGCILIPLAGLEPDEAVFGLATFGGLSREFTLSIFRHQFPLMIFFYAGSLKGLLYWPVLHLFGSNLWTIRLPVVIAGAVSVGLLYDFAKHIANRRVALVAALLLATDPCFLLSNTYDWGPVAMEHLLLLTGLVLLARGRIRVACFVFGLGLWNKAIFSWALSGLIVGGVAVYWPAIRRVIINGRFVAQCILAFVIGCLPLILYNIRQPAATARANVHLTFEGLADKLTSLRYTLDGSDLFGIVAGMDGVTDPTAIRFHSLFLPAVLIALAVALWRWRSAEFKPALFAIAFCATSFLLIGLTRYAGAAHHIVLLYPMPHLLVATAICSIRWRHAAVAIATVVIAANLMVFNTYVTQLHRSGPIGLFTDAIGPLSNTFNDTTDHVYTLDFGMWENVFLLHSGKLRITPVRTPDEMPAALKDPQAVFVNHLRGHEFYTGSADQIDEAAAKLGLRKAGLRSITDSKGRAQFEVFRYQAR